MPPERIVVAGVAGSDACALPSAVRDALGGAELVAGGARHLDALVPRGVPTVRIGADMGVVLDAIAEVPGTAVVLASGDPGFFGVLRALSQRFGAGALDVHPAPSSVSLAFARLGTSWDDAAVVSAHGRPLDDAVEMIARHPKVAVLVSPDNPPERLGRALLDAGCGPRDVAVCARLGLDGEHIGRTDLDGLAGGTWDPLSVVVVRAPGALGCAGGKGIAWGLAEGEYAHRGGMITRAEVRAIALGKLDLPAAGVLWDIGAGSGSVAIEAARVCPGLAVHAVERNMDDAARLVANATAHEVTVQVLAAEAPACLDELPDPDRVFVGGGGTSVLDACLARLRPGGQAVATYAAMDRALVAFDRLGALTQVTVARGQRLPGGGLRLASENPVFVVWGPRP